MNGSKYSVVLMTSRVVEGVLTRARETGTYTSTMGTVRQNQSAPVSINLLPFSPQPRFSIEVQD